MLEVEQIKDGVFKLTFTAMHYEWLDNAAKNSNGIREAVIALWVSIGVSKMPELCVPLPQVTTEPPKSSEPVEVDNL